MGRDRSRSHSFLVAALTVALIVGQVPGNAAARLSFDFPDFTGALGQAAHDALTSARSGIAPVAAAVDCGPASPLFDAV